MSKDSYIHMGVEYYNTPTRGGCPIMRRVIKIYKKGIAEDSRSKKQSEMSRTKKLTS